MQHTVWNAWVGWNTPLEGNVNWMYLDTHKPPLVTTAMGNLIDPIDLALALPWRLVGHGRLATKDEIRAEWSKVKADTKLSAQGAKAASYVTMLRLSPSAVDGLISRRLSETADALKKTFVEFEMWPADAQLGLLSMGWAMGPAFTAKFPKLTAACQSMNFETAALECWMNGSPAPVRRNTATALAFSLAAGVVANDTDFSVLRSPVPPA